MADRHSRAVTRWTSAVLVALALAIVIWWAPNPLGRFSEAGAGTYRDFRSVLVASGSPRLRDALRETLTQDGKLTQANLTPLWQLYERALPVGYAPANTPPDTLDEERRRLRESVGLPAQ